MFRYAGWLDGETQKIRRQARKLDRLAHAEDAHSVLKMSALLGHSISLIDIQLIDSSPLLLAFNDPGFREAAAVEGSNWLQFRARPHRNDEGLPPQRARVRSALHRSKHPDWVSSSYEDDVFARRFFVWLEAETRGGLGNADAIIETARVQGILPQTPHNASTALDADHLTGAVHALAFFDSGKGINLAPPVQAIPVTFDSVLSNLTQMNPGDEEIVQEVLDFIEDRFGEDSSRTRRSALQTALGEKGVTGVRRKRIWNTAVVAWNCAAAASIDANGGVYGHLPHAARVPTYLGDVTDVALHGNEGRKPVAGIRAELLDALYDLDYDFSRFPWSEIRRLLEDDGFRELRRRYHHAVETNEIADDVQPFRALTKLIAAAVAQYEQAAARRNFVWVAAPVLAELLKISAETKMVPGSKQVYAAMKYLSQYAVGLQVVSTLERYSESPMARE